jgi:hypothetical protein
MWTFTRRSVVPRAVLLVFAMGWITVAGAPAQATPVTVWFDGTNCPSCYGLDAASVSAFLAAGGQVLTPSSMFGDPNHTLFSVSSPDPGSVTIPSGTISKSNPITATTSRTVTALSASYQNLWGVFVTHDPNDPVQGYLTGNVGFSVDPTSGQWALIQPTGSQGVSYLAIFLGNLQQGGSTTVTLNYREAQMLIQNPPGSNQYYFPRLVVGFAVPEPGTLVLVATGLLGALAARRRSC